MCGHAWHFACFSLLPALKTFFEQSVHSHTHVIMYTALCPILTHPTAELPCSYDLECGRATGFMLHIDSLWACAENTQTLGQYLGFVCV